MRKWIWRILLAVAIAAALSGTAMAEEVKYPSSGNNSIRYELSGGTGTVLGPVKPADITSAQIVSELQGVKITKIADDAFNGCGKLTSVTIESGVQSIGDNSFNSCPVLQSVLLPDSIRSIGKYAFANCGRLNNVVLPSVLTTIQTGTFASCGALTSIYISSVSTIERAAFTGTGVRYLHCDDSINPTQADNPGLPVHAASPIPGVVTAPTCTVDGSRVYSYNCSICTTGFRFTQTVAIPANGHTQGDLIERVDPTCSTPGTEAGRRCTVCNTVLEGLKTIPIDPDNHAEAPIAIPDVEATCTKAGSQGGKQCPSCGVVTEEPTEVSALGHTYGPNCKTREYTVRETSCAYEGCVIKYRICDVCGQLEECADCEQFEEERKESGSEEISDAYKAHLNGEHGAEWTPVTDHTPGEPKVEIVQPTCTAEGKKTVTKVCSVCKQEYGDPEEEVIPAAGHKFPEATEENTVSRKDATCTEAGEVVYVSGTKCTVCDTEIPESELTVIIPALDHDWVPIPEDEYEVITAATCTEKGVSLVGGQKCSRCEETRDREEKETAPTGHEWGDFIPDPGQDATQAEDCHEKTVKGSVVCEKCGHIEERTITIPGKMNHSWGPWEPGEEGEEVRICSVCGAEETRDAETPEPDDDDDDDDSDADDDDDTPGPDTPESKDYTVTVVQASNGTVTASRTTARQGTTITFTATPSSGYEVDMIRVISGGTGVLNYTRLGGGRYSFTMPAANVEIRVSFSSAGGNSDYYWDDGSPASNTGSPRRTTDVMPTQNPALTVPGAESSGQLFSDIPSTYWAAGEIEWASQMGYMNGTNGRFNPTWNISHQQLWMVMARLTGTYPASMAEARDWAVRNAFADGSAPTGAVPRHHLIKALYRCATLMGSTNRYTTSLAGYTDSRNIPAGSRDAMAWAVANGIITGDSSNRLNPTATVTREQFAVILYRFSQRV